MNPSSQQESEKSKQGTVNKNEFSFCNENGERRMLEPRSLGDVPLAEANESEESSQEGQSSANSQVELSERDDQEEEK